MVDTNINILKIETSCVDFRMFAANKEHSSAHPVTQTGKSSGRHDGALVGSTEEEQTETFHYWLRLARSQIRCKERTL
jgi:hypothetical protein